MGGRARGTKSASPGKQQDLPHRRVIMASIMTSAALAEYRTENAMRSLHEDGGTNDADGRSASDMAKLGQEPDKNDGLETIQEKSWSEFETREMEEYLYTLSTGSNVAAVRTSACFADSIQTWQESSRGQSSV